jgi:biopolymer transport protein TolR
VELPKGKVNSSINVTPLVDVMLVLLIIFMVVTPMLQRGAAVMLPVTGEPSKKEEDKDQILVAVQQNESVAIEQGTSKETVSMETLGDRLKEYYQRDPGATVVLKGDARLTYGVVKKAMLDVKKAGFEAVGLITKKRDQT